MTAGALHSTLFPADLYALALHSEIDAIVAALRAKPGDVWTQLLSTVRDPRVQGLFEAAREEASPFVLPDEMVFPELYPMCALIDEQSSFLGDVDELRSVPLPSATAGFEPAGPGIHRLQHASVLYRSRAGTGIMTDPVTGQDKQSWISPHAIANLDAILISHSHRDHFSLLTLMQFPRDMLIIVPKVERASMLCPDMAAVLREAGFTNVVAAAWFSRIRVKDVEIVVYPFYGEQPWITFGSPVAELRNQGNTYVVDMDGHKSWLLIDSGQEFEHSMVDLCDRVRDEVGSIDLVLSNLREFPWFPKQIDGSGRFLLCFPEDILATPERWPEGQITFGTDGMRQFLDALEPNEFAPYAHWWHPREQTPHLVDNIPESELLTRLGPGRTTIRSWQVGDVITTR